jgi:hypothetical protein
MAFTILNCYPRNTHSDRVSADGSLMKIQTRPFSADVKRKKNSALSGKQCWAFLDSYFCRFGLSSLEHLEQQNLPRNSFNFLKLLTHH